MNNKIYVKNNLNLETPQTIAEQVGKKNLKKLSVRINNS